MFLDELTKRYIRGNSLICADEGARTAKEYFSMDMHGNVVQLIGEDGKVKKTYTYDSFGNEENPDKNSVVRSQRIGSLPKANFATHGRSFQSNKKDDNPFRYCGEYFDKETETMYLRARSYDAELGRFLTRDTYTGEDADALSLNLYTYCSNDGVNRVDPSGHDAIWLNSSESAYGFGHAAVLVKNSSGKWDYLTYTNKGLSKKTLNPMYSFLDDDIILKSINHEYRKGADMGPYNDSIHFYGKFKSIKQ